MHSTAAMASLKVSLVLAVSCAVGLSEKTPEILRDPSFLQLLNKHYSSIQQSTTQPTHSTGSSYHGYVNARYLPHQEQYLYGSTSDETAYGPSGSKLSLQREQQQQQAESVSVDDSSTWKQKSSNPISSQENWNGYSILNASQDSTATGLTGQDVEGGEGSYLSSHYSYDPMDGSHSMIQYQQQRPTTPTYFSLKNSPWNQSRRQIIKVSDDASKSKYKKQVVYYAGPVGYRKKTVYSRVKAPYVSPKYPNRKTLHPYYRRYYQNHYGYPQFPSSEMHRNKINKYNAYSDGYGHHSSLVAATTTPDTMATSITGRTESIYTEKPPLSEDYTNYNDTYYNGNRLNNRTNYYETYQQTQADTSRDEYEATTRGYYGDRIYMSTQTPHTFLPDSTTDKTPSKHRLYFVRSEAKDDDIETIFE